MLMLLRAYIDFDFQQFQDRYVLVKGRGFVLPSEFTLPRPAAFDHKVSLEPLSSREMVLLICDALNVFMHLGLSYVCFSRC